MTFTEILKDIFRKKSKKIGKGAVDNSGSGRTRRFLSKISGAFMLPISIMAVAGLFLGVGAAINSHTDAKIFGAFIKNLGDPIFGAMPLLFMVAIVIAFTDDIGTAVFAGIIAFLVFNAIQMPFINDKSYGNNVGKAYFLGINTSDAISFRVYKIVGANLGIKSMNTSIFGGIVVGFVMSWIYKKFHMIELPKYISFFGGKRFVGFAGILAVIPISFLFLLVWPWVGLGLAYFGEYSGKVSGLDSFIFGFVERSLIPFGLHHVFYSPLWWTAAGGNVVATIEKGAVITSINGGEITSGTLVIDDLRNIVDKFNSTLVGDKNIASQIQDKLVGQVQVDGNDVFAYDEVSKKLSIGSSIKASLFTKTSGPIFYTNLNNAIQNIYKNPSSSFDLIHAVSTTYGNKHEYISNLNGVAANLVKNATGGNYLGDSFGWLAVNSSGITKVNATPIYQYIANNGLKLGRFMQGKFSFMQLGLPAAGVAMVMTAKKENRKMAASIIFPAALTSFITGVTEPIEFTFLFLAPWLFWGFHATMAAFSFLFMNILGAHVGMTFSGGIIDTIIYGGIPFSLGTNFYWMYVIGAVYAPIYYFVFYFAIKKFNLETPGRGTNTQLFTKKDFLAKRDASKSGLKPQSIAIIKALGGWSNITKFSNCATRLRYDIKSMAKVNEKSLKAAGASGIMKQGKNHVQIIMGTQAEQINTNIKANKNAKLT